MKYTLVTGGAGFIGSHLIDNLINTGKKVICIDNLISGSILNINRFRNHPNFKFIIHNVEDKYPSEIDDYWFDEIYNLASIASPYLYKKLPINTIKTNILGAMNVIQIAQNTNAKIFHASTSEIYGHQIFSLSDEDDVSYMHLDSPRACYAESKRMVETLFRVSEQEYGPRIKIGRIFNTYGPKMRIDDGRVVSNFIVAALKNEPLILEGGDQTRSFCYIDDTIRGITSLMKSDFTGPMNIGNSEEISIRELAEKIIQKTYSTSEIRIIESRPHEIQFRRPSVELAAKQLNWRPVVSLDDGLDKTISFFRKELGQLE